MRTLFLTGSSKQAFSIFAARTVLAVLLVLLPVVSQAKTAIFQPDSSNSNKSIFFQISEQLQKSKKVRGIPYLINANSSAKSAKSWLLKNKVKYIITLGSPSLRFAKSAASGLDIKIIAGGITNIPTGHSGVSLTTSPTAFFKLLKLFAPQVRKVSLVYSQEQNGWWINEAKQQAKKNKIALKLYEVKSIKQGVRSYKKIIDNANVSSEAIWIPLVDLVPNKIIMSIVLKTAWLKEIVIFSNNPAHVKQGALFSLYPDNKNLAGQLIKVVTALKKQDKRIISPTVDVKTAVNVRTAKHLGLNLSSAELVKFDRIYPRQ